MAWGGLGRKGGAPAGRFIIAVGSNGRGDNSAGNAAVALLMTLAAIAGSWIRGRRERGSTLAVRVEGGCRPPAGTRIGGN